MKLYKMPPAEDLKQPLQVIRPKAEKPLNTILLSESWVGIYTHWWGGKTIRCPDDVCRACDRNVPRMWKGFIPVSDGVNRDSKALLQFTGRCVSKLSEHVRDPGGLLGARVLWTRIGKAVNSPLRCEVMGWADVRIAYSEDRVADIVCALFRGNGEFDPRPAA